MKGILLAGGRATRLYPLTKVISKQILPVYDKPMIYYPLSVLMLAGICDILIISTQEALPLFKDLLGDGSSYGLSLQYKEQLEPRGIAEAFILAEDFIGNDEVALILGDNIFFGEGLNSGLKKAATLKDGALVFGYYVNEPERYGVIEFDDNKNVVSIEEKPQNPKSHWAVTGLYFYDNDVIGIAKELKPSARGELEITDINKAYLNQGKLRVVLLERGNAWLDTGTCNSLIDAALFIKTVEERQGLKIGCIEEIAYRNKYITGEQLLKQADKTRADYGAYLRAIIGE